MADDSPLSAALRLQADAAAEGFDWDALAPMWAKLQEEIGELRQDAGQPDRAREELGDLLFMVVNIARHLGVDPDRALVEANRKFVRRYAHVRNDIAALPPIGDPKRLAAMESRWQQAKRIEAAAQHKERDDD